MWDEPSGFRDKALSGATQSKGVFPQNRPPQVNSCSLCF